MISVQADAAISEAFKDKLMLPPKDTAKLLGFSTKTLARMTDDGVIQAVRRGKLRAYTEQHIREYLSEGSDVSRPSKHVTNIRYGRVSEFTKRRRRREHLQRTD